MQRKRGEVEVRTGPRKGFVLPRVDVTRTFLKRCKAPSEFEYAAKRLRLGQ